MVSSIWQINLLDQVLMEWSLSTFQMGKKLCSRRRFSEDEVWNVVSGMKGDKASGPDDFSISFFLEMLGYY